jgi:hypothetical protein
LVVKQSDSRFDNETQSLEYENMRIFFNKELLSNSFMVNGASVPFEVLDGNRGVIALDTETDAVVVGALRTAAAKHRCGISIINEVQYNAKKNLYKFNPSAPKLKKDVLRALPPSIKPAKFNPIAAVAGINPLGSTPAATPAPASAEAQVAIAEKPKFRPSTRRISRREAVVE